MSSSACLHILVAASQLVHHFASSCVTLCQVAPKRPPPPPLLHVHGSTSDEIHVYYHWLSFLTTAEDDPQTFYQSCTIVPKLPLLLLVPREFVCLQILRRGCFSWKRVGSSSRRLKAFRVKRGGEDGGQCPQVHGRRPIWKMLRGAGLGALRAILTQINQTAAVGPGRPQGLRPPGCESGKPGAGSTCQSG